MPEDNLGKEEKTKQDNLLRLLTLERQLNDVKNMRKEVLRDYRDQIKDIEEEIKEVLEILK